MRILAKMGRDLRFDSLSIGALVGGTARAQLRDVKQPFFTRQLLVCSNNGRIDPERPENYLEVGATKHCTMRSAGCTVLWCLRQPPLGLKELVLARFESGSL